MLVIHGIWAYGELYAWAEDSALPAQRPPRSGRPSRAPGPHPFAIAAEALAVRLAGAFPGDAADLVGAAVDDELTVRLPSVPGGPLASPGLFRPEAEEPPAAARAPLALWRVPALAVEPRLAGPFLAALAGLPPGGLTAGAGIGYLAAVARFAADLADRGRVLPALVQAADGYAARWRPVLSGADARYARELAAAMPAAVEAAPDLAPGAAVAPGPGPLLAGILDALADAQARTRLAGPVLPARKGRRPARIPVAERMLLALAGPDASVELADAKDEREAAALSATFAGWLSGAVLPASAVRTCFRLVEPPDGVELGPAAGQQDFGPEEDLGQREDPGQQADPGQREAAGRPHEALLAPRDIDEPGPWRVEFSLQSVDDPSLRLPAEDVWAGEDNGWLTGSGSAAADPEEELLAGLGAAARLFPALDRALRTAAPSRLELDTEGALEFLRETGPLLSGAGFGVLLPDWARRARLGLKLTTRSASGSPTSARTGQLAMQDLVNFRYDLALGDHTLTPLELGELARLKVPLVRVRGQWVELDERHLKAALKFLERGQSGTMTAAEAIAIALAPGAGGPDDADGLPLAEVDADGWLGDLLSGQADDRLAPMETPDGFRGTLRPYQQRGLSWLSFLGRLGVGAVLADDMGLGKTVQLLSLLWAEKESAASVRADPVFRTLLICPMSLTGNWQREAERFTPGLTVHVHHGAGRLAGDELDGALATADLVITTYQTAARDLAELSRVRWARVVCDEAQAIKNHRSQQAKAVRALPAASRIALTGTPVENQLSELWSIMEFANPGMLGSAQAFRDAYAVPIERFGSEEAAQRLRQVTQPFVLRRLKTDKSIISDLPAKQEMKVWCNLTAEQASLYQATVTDMLARIDRASGDMSRRGLVLATMAKLKQVCNHPAHLLGDGSRLDGRSGKLARLEELGEEIVADGDKALCFTQYAEFGRMLQPYLTARIGCEVLFLHGGTSKKQRDAMVARFQEADEPVLFLLSLKAGGTGLNLTAANHVIHVDRWWNPAVEDQATDRAFRIGQRRDVQVRKFVCVGTLEERIDAMIEQKKALAEQIVGTGESWLTELSTAALREVLALSPEAVSS
jgi:SNF2 family DNA or RNA helicase